MRDIEILNSIKRGFLANRVFYSEHAKDEMVIDKFGKIYESEVFEAVASGKVIESYPDDKPYPSILIYGTTKKKRPLHIVCAYSEEEDLTIVITTYQPDPELWVGYIRRKG